MDTQVTVTAPHTRWITPDEYKMYTGTDLTLRLPVDDLGGDAAERFIVRVENEVESYISAHYFHPLILEDMTLQQKRHFKIGLIYQVEYTINNGDVGGWSGIDEQGKHISRYDIINSMMSPKAMQEFSLAGLTSRHIGGGILDGWYGY